MNMTAPAPHNAIDENLSGLIGKPIDRVEGRLKVTGRAPYAHDVPEGDRAVVGYIVEATIGKGTVADIDASQAEKAEGVLMVMTHLNAPRQGAWGPIDATDRHARASPQLASNKVEHYGQAVAFVVAYTFEQARSAARLIRIKYDVHPGEYEMAPLLAKADKPPDQPGQKSDSAVGNFESAFGSAAVKVDSRYTTPAQSHAQMEPHATVAAWDGGSVTLYCAAQLLMSAQKAVAATLQIPPERVRIVSRYIGGGFGGKLPV